MPPSKWVRIQARTGEAMKAGHMRCTTGTGVGSIDAPKRTWGPFAQSTWPASAMPPPPTFTAKRSSTSLFSATRRRPANCAPSSATGSWPLRSGPNTPGLVVARLMRQGSPSFKGGITCPAIVNWVVPAL